MELIKYEIKNGDTLQSVAEFHNISVKELIKFHNENCGLTNLIIGDQIPLQLNYLLIEKNRVKKVSETNDDFEDKARYRCEQINTSKFNDNLVHYVEQKFQYLLKLNLTKEKAFVSLENYSHQISPNFLSETFDFIEATDKIKNNVLFSLHPDSGKPKEILNKKEIYENWQNFRDNDFPKMPFTIKIGETNPAAIQELIDMGDQQFSLSANKEEEYWRNFFYFCCFDQYLFNEKDWKEVSFDFISTIVPPLVIPLKLRYDKIDEKDGITTIRKVAEYELSESLLNEIKQRYDELHKDVIKYDFTAYKIIFRTTLELDSYTKIINNARVVLKEEISDNIENECIFTIKKLENFTP